MEPTAEDYFSHPRPEVRALIPSEARWVVDVGCGAGALGAALKAERPQVQVRGIEPDARAAERARRVLDGVAVAGAEGEVPPSWPAPDCIVLADVLEHLADPAAALLRWRSWLRPGGWLVVSMPNVGHVSILRALWRGRWDYVEEGLLDRTHLRFFTRATAAELLEGAGFAVERTQRILRAPARSAVEWSLWPFARAGLLLEERGRLAPGPLGRALDLCTYQVLFRARHA